MDSKYLKTGSLDVRPYVGGDNRPRKGAKWGWALEIRRSCVIDYRGFSLCPAKPRRKPFLEGTHDAM